jgi:hypothetical protein
LEPNHQLWRWLNTFPSVLERSVSLLRCWYDKTTPKEKMVECRLQLVYTFECCIPTITNFFWRYFREADLHSVEGMHVYEDLPSQLLEQLQQLFIVCKEYELSLQLEFVLGGVEKLEPFVMGIRSRQNRDKKRKAKAGMVEGAEEQQTEGQWKLAKEKVPKTRTNKKRERRGSLADFQLGLHVAGGNHQRTTTTLRSNFRRSLQGMFDTNEVQAFLIKEKDEIRHYFSALPRAKQFVDGAWAERVGILRLEPLVAKLVAHIRSLVIRHGSRKLLNLEHVPTTKWILCLFQGMIEQAWGFTIDERDELGDGDSDEKVTEIQTILNDANAPQMCIELIAKGLDREVVNGATKLLVALLYKEGGHIKVQKTLYKYFEASNTELFFEELQAAFTRIGAWETAQMKEFQAAQQHHEAEEAVKAEQKHLVDINMLQKSKCGNEEKSSSSLRWGKGTLEAVEAESTATPALEEKNAPPPEQLLLLMLQLMCEGHYLSLQHQLREQPKNGAAKTVNLLDEMVTLMQSASKARTQSTLLVTISAAGLILESIQGPCKENQEHFANKTELLATMNHMLHVEVANDQDDDDLQELKTTMLQIFKALLEGQEGGVSGSSSMRERILAVLHIEALQMLIDPPPLDIEGEDVDLQEEIERQEAAKAIPLAPVQVESLVLMQMLIGEKVTESDELHLSDAILARIGVEVISVEVIWNGILQRRFFHVPDVCKHLSKTTRAHLVSTVNRKNQDTKLNDFVCKSQIVLAELEHSEYLFQRNLSNLFSRTNQDNATWITFFINIIINLIYVINLKWIPVCSDSGVGDGWTALECMPSSPTFLKTEMRHVDKNLESVLVYFNVSQILLSCFTLVLFLVVRAPVTYRVTMSETGSWGLAFLSIWTKSLTSYYVVYTIFAILGMIGNPFFNTLLLYDVLVKNSTSRDVLKAVYIPIKSLAATVILGVFSIYVFSFVIFLFFAPDFEMNTGTDVCESLLRCFQITAGFGLRNGGGIGDIIGFYSPLNEDVLNEALGPRFLLDLLFFLIVIIVLLNIIFGIIIDTFSELREEKKEKLINTIEKCFICGINKDDFDSQGPGVFAKHIEHAHNMWAYLNFMVFIWLQDRDDDDGLEQYMRSCLDRGDISWFPSNKALSLVQEEQGEEKIENGIEELKAICLKTQQRQAVLTNKMTEELKIIKQQIRGLETVRSDTTGVASDTEDHAAHQAVDGTEGRLSPMPLRRSPPDGPLINTPLITATPDVRSSTNSLPRVHARRGSIPTRGEAPYPTRERASSRAM